jgi:uncharacterized protein (DUF3820 family)
VFSFLQERLLFKSQNRETRSLPETLFTETEEKLVRLGLNEAAHQGESDNSAVMLFRSLRRRGVDAEQLIASMTQSTWAMRELSSARGYVMTFGQYKGKTVGQVPRDYIEWALRECRNLSLNLRRAMQIVLKEGNR